MLTSKLRHRHLKTYKMEIAIFYMILVCCLVVAETAKLQHQHHSDSGGRHLSRISLEQVLNNRHKASKKDPGKISIQLLTSALKNVLSIQQDFTLSDRSVSQSLSFTDDSQPFFQSIVDPFSGKISSTELDFNSHSKEITGKSQISGSLPIVTIENSPVIEVITKTGTDTSKTDQNVFVSEILPLISQSDTESVDASLLPQQFTVSEVDSEHPESSNPESSGRPSLNNHFIVPSLDSSFHDQQFTAFNSETSEQQDQPSLEYLFFISSDQQFTDSHKEISNGNSNSDSEVFVAQSSNQEFQAAETSQQQSPTDSSSFSSLSLDSKESLHQDNIKSNSFPHLIHEHQLFSMPSFKSQDVSHQNIESLAPVSFHQQFRIPHLEVTSQDSHSNSFQDQRPDLSLSHPETKSFVKALHDQQSTDIPRQIVSLEYVPFVNHDHHIISENSDQFSSHTGQQMELISSSDFIDSHNNSGSKPLETNEHLSLNIQLNNFSLMNTKFEEQRIQEPFYHFSSTESEQASPGTNVFVGSSLPPEGINELSSKQYSLNQNIPIFEDLLCPGDEIRHVDGRCVTPEISRRIFVIDVPDYVAGIPSKQGNSLHRVEEDIVFIRTSDRNQIQSPINERLPQRRDTIYILNANAQDHGHRIVDVPVSPAEKPKVYFLNYSDGQRPTLPDGLDLETALSSAIPIEGKVINGNGKLSSTLSSSGIDSDIPFTNDGKAGIHERTGDTFNTFI